MTKKEIARQAKIKALYLVGNNSLVICDSLDMSELTEAQGEALIEAIDEVCGRLLERAYKLENR